MKNVLSGNFNLWRANWNVDDWKRLVYKYELGEVTKTDWLRLHKFIHSIQLDNTNAWYVEYLKKMYLTKFSDLSTEADYTFARCLRLTGSLETQRSWKAK